MEKLLLLLLVCCLGFPASSQYWQQEADYTIDVSLDDKQKTLDGFEKIVYTNHSPDTLHFIWFHLWPNAYKNDKTAFSDQLLENGNTKFYFSGREQKGYINRLDFKADGSTAKTEDHPQHIDIIKVILPKPLAPHQKITITTPFHVKLPFNFSRGGYDGQSFQLTQWYPKPAVYDSKGWHPMPYLDQGEFYSEFGNFDVQITIPKEYVVAATGELQNEEEKEWLKTKLTVPTSGGQKRPVNKIANKTKITSSKKQATPATRDVKTLRLRQNDVHDFALFLNKNFIVGSDTCKLASGKIITVSNYYTKEEEYTWKNSLQFIKDAVRFYSNEVGEYPYNTLSVVQGPQSFGGGMEYPTITIISPTASSKELDITMAHEIGHNWFYGILASNERENPWMDEGINSFYEKKYTELKYGKGAEEEEIFFQTKAFKKKDQPIQASSEEFSVENYALVAYHKTAEWMRYLEETIGKDAFRQMMQAYFREWKFKHPQPENFKAFVATQPNTARALDLLNTNGVLPNHQLSGFKIISPLIKNSFKNYFQSPTKDALIISPAVGVNNYDKWMLGVVFTNYKLPPNSFQYFMAPLYAFNSKTLNGAAHIGYSKNNISFDVGGLRFSKNLQIDTTGKKHFERFERLTPHIRYNFNYKPRETKESWIEAKAFFIREKEFAKFVTKSTDDLLYVDSSKTSSRYVTQFTYSFANYRALYPHNYQLQVQQGKEFTRLNATGNYFFNYAKGGGMNVRVFASKFFSINEDNSLSTFLYRPKLLGVTGEEDFTYSNYFVGRTASYGIEGTAKTNAGLAAQQIMIRDGGLKLRMDQFEDVQGRSENWVAAVNFNTTLPSNLFPVNLPVKVFFDIGTYAEAWKPDASTSRFLYVGGLQLSILKNVVNIYAPLIYSSEFRDNLKTLPEQNKFFKRLTFSIDIQRLALRQFTGYNLF